jgi:predicted permease
LPAGEGSQCNGLEKQIVYKKGARAEEEGMLRDLSIALRTLSKSPAVPALAVLTLSVGIGCAAAGFHLIDEIVLRSLPVDRPERLTGLFHRSLSEGYYSSFSYPDYLDYREHNTVFDSLVAFSPTSVSLRIGRAAASRVEAELVTGDYFQALGVPTILGRAFLPGEDDRPDAEPVVVLSHRLWRRMFGSSPAAVGETIVLNGHAVNVIGVVPKGFHGLDFYTVPDVWVPLSHYRMLMPDFDLFYNRGTHWLSLVGRLGPDVDRTVAQSELKGLAGRLSQVHPHILGDFAVEIASAEQGMISPPDRRTLVLLAGLFGAVVGVVFLVVCANVAGLLIARSVPRRREYAVRLALGAGRWAIMRQVLAESLLLSLVAGTVGAFIAVWSVRALLSLESFGWLFPALERGPSPWVFVFGFAVCLFAAGASGALTALEAARRDPARALQGSQRSEYRSRSPRGQSVLVVAQVAGSLLLLITAALFTQSLHNQLSVDLGFDTDDLLLVSFDVGSSGYTEDKGRSVQRALPERVKVMPGVSSAGLAKIVPLGRRRMAMSVLRDEGAEPISFEANAVSPDYFRTLGIPLLRGRDFASGESDAVAVINDEAARRLWPAEEPIGKRIRLKSRPDEALEVIGVVGDTQQGRILREKTRLGGLRPWLYLPLSRFYYPDVTLHLRVAGMPESQVAMVRREMAALDRNLPFEIRTFHEHVASGLTHTGLMTRLLECFSIIALALAALGLYGLLAYSVGRRTHEIGIRRALGARRKNVLRLVIVHGIKLTSIGVAVGLGLAIALTRFIAGLLFEVHPTNAVTFVGSAVILVAVALLATYVPASRAVKVDPIVALRDE